MTEVDELLMNGNLKEAMESMRSQPGYEEEMSGYVDLFVNKNYRKYEVSERLNEILETYQEYFREVFYCGTGEEQAAIRLMQKLCFMLSVNDMIPSEQRATLISVNSFTFSLVMIVMSTLMGSIM